MIHSILKPNRSRFVFVCVFILHTLSITSKVNGDDFIPKYKFVLGSELTFHGREVFKINGQESESKILWKVIAAKQSFGGAWRLVFAFGDIDRPDWYQAKTGIKWMYADVKPSGEFEAKPSDPDWINPSVCFPRLPELENHFRVGWNGVIVDAERTYMEVIPRKPNEAEWFKFHGTTHRPLDKLYDAQSESWYDYEIRSGFVNKILSSMKRSVYADAKAIEQTGSGITELIATRQLEAKWIRNFAREQKLYFEALKFWKLSLIQAEREPASCVSIIRNASQQLINARKSMKTPSFVHHLQQLIDNEDRYIHLTQDRAERRSVWIGKPAPNWEVKMEEGKRRTLTDLRGRVTILEFWHSGSDLAIEELTLLREINQKYVKHSPRVVGMNVDTNFQDADFVISRLNLGFEQLPAMPIAEKYKITKFPTTMVLNAHGIVIDYIEGGIKKERSQLEYVLDKEFGLRR